jgi:two-component system NtrC family sensor kinase
MGKKEADDGTLSSILQERLSANDPRSRYQYEEEQLKQALLRRPSFSVRSRLTLIFLVFFLISAGVSVTTMIMLSDINDRIELVNVADRLANEIQHARRSEKNYFLYGSELSEVLSHVANADEFLRQASIELGHVVGTGEIDSIRSYLTQYREAAGSLISKEQSPEFKRTAEFQTMADSLRTYGTKMLGLSLEISAKERQQIARATERSRRINFALLFILLLMSVFVASHIYRHIIARLNRIMEATQRFAAGDFLPITPRRKYKDEFSQLVIALNHMMYELERRQNLLVESHKIRAIGNLTAGVAHELNNPLNNIILTTEVLKDSYKELTDEELKDIVDDLITQGERAQRVVKNLLDFARESETQTEYLRIDRLLEDTIQLAKNQIKLSKIELKVDIEKNLPPIYGDKEQLKQVFLNLFINAIDAMPSGGSLSIEVTRERDTGFIAVDISDTGDGIPPHILGSIFNPFFTTKPTGKGTGLGLAVSRGIIEKHGGDIEVKSRPREGATFTVHLPIVPIPAEMGNHPDNA